MYVLKVTYILLITSVQSEEKWILTRHPRPDEAEILHVPGRYIDYRSTFSEPVSLLLKHQAHFLLRNRDVSFDGQSGPEK